MNLTLPLAAWLSLIVACFAWGVIIGAAVMLDVIQSGRPRSIAPMHVSLSRLADPEPLPYELGPFPGDGEALWLESDLSDRRCASHDALDQFAREYQGLTR